LTALFDVDPFTFAGRSPIRQKTQAKIGFSLLEIIHQRQMEAEMRPYSMFLEHSSLPAPRLWPNTFPLQWTLGQRAAHSLPV
jgi:hypothetical protein